MENLLLVILVLFTLMCLGMAGIIKELARIRKELEKNNNK